MNLKSTHSSVSFVSFALLYSLNPFGQHTYRFTHTNTHTHIQTYIVRFRCQDIPLLILRLKQNIQCFRCANSKNFLHSILHITRIQYSHRQDWVFSLASVQPQQLPLHSINKDDFLHFLKSFLQLSHQIRNMKMYSTLSFCCWIVHNLFSLKMKITLDCKCKLLNSTLSLSL